MSSLQVPSIRGGTRSGLVSGTLLIAVAGGFLLWSSQESGPPGVRDQVAASYYERHGEIVSADEVESLATLAAGIPSMEDKLARQLARGCHGVRDDCLTRGEARFLRFYADWWSQRLDWARERAHPSPPLTDSIGSRSH